MNAQYKIHYDWYGTKHIDECDTLDEFITQISAAHNNPKIIVEKIEVTNQ